MELILKPVLRHLLEPVLEFVLEPILEHVLRHVLENVLQAAGSEKQAADNAKCSQFLIVSGRKKKTASQAQNKDYEVWV